jgi:TolA-binding protein
MATTATATGEATHGSLEAMAAVLERQHSIIEARMEKQQDKMEQKIEQLQEKMEATVEKQRAEHQEDMDRQRETAERQRQEAEAKMEEQRLQTDHMREVASAKSCVSEGQLELLQTRLDALHQAKLLTDDEIGALEDCVADYIDCRSSLNPAAAEIGVAAEKVKKMVGLSEGIAKDGMLARQLRRKLAAGQ